MPVFNVVAPYLVDIDATDLTSAVKKFAKTYYHMKVDELIIKDQIRNHRARIKYLNQNNRNRMGISIAPFAGGFVPGSMTILDADKQLRMRGFLHTKFPDGSIRDYTYHPGIVIANKVEVKKRDGDSKDDEKSEEEKKDEDKKTTELLEALEALRKARDTTKETKATAKEAEDAKRSDADAAKKAADDAVAEEKKAKERYEKALKAAKSDDDEDDDESYVVSPVMTPFGPRRVMHRVKKGKDRPRLVLPGLRPAGLVHGGMLSPVPGMMGPHPPISPGRVPIGVTAHPVNIKDRPGAVGIGLHSPVGHVGPMGPFFR